MNSPPPTSATTLTFSNSVTTATTPTSDVREWILIGPGDVTEKITGRLIGFATSHRERHSGHSDEFAARGDKCSACRWFEVRIFTVAEQQQQYVIHTQGPTMIPGEYVKSRVERAYSAHELIEILTVRQGEKVFLPAASARAIAQAAGSDKHVLDAYVNRAVM